jgi:hypothetical protein
MLNVQESGHRWQSSEWLATMVVLLYGDPQEISSGTPSDMMMSCASASPLLPFA